MLPKHDFFCSDSPNLTHFSSLRDQFLSYFLWMAPVMALGDARSTPNPSRWHRALSAGQLSVPQSLLTDVQ